VVLEKGEVAKASPEAKATGPVTTSLSGPGGSDDDDDDDDDDGGDG
jgi:hypothetical protein